MTHRDVEPDGVRLDKWLWAARFYKTRSLAAEALSRGKILVNGSPAKSSRRIRVGDRLGIRKGPYEWELEVTGLSEKRGPASEAVTLYQEPETSVSERQRVSKILQSDRLSRPIVDGKPDKKERRKLLSIKKRTRT